MGSNKKDPPDELVGLLFRLPEYPVNLILKK